MKKFVSVLVILLIALADSTKVCADTLTEVLKLYGVVLYEIDPNDYLLGIAEAEERYLQLLDSYRRDEYFRLTADVASVMEFNNVNLAWQLEIDRLYLESLVNIEADLDLIFEAERSYRETRDEYILFAGERATFSLGSIALSGVTSFDVNSVIDEMHVLNRQMSAINIRPDIGVFGMLPSPTKDIWNFSSGFGYRMDPFDFVTRWHNGIDLPAPQGTEVISMFAGKVIYAGNKNNGLGNYVLIAHSNEFQTLYAHMNEVVVKTGDFVNQFQAVGKVGSTGRSTGNHLHFAVYINGNASDPMRLFRGR